MKFLHLGLSVCTLLCGLNLVGCGPTPSKVTRVDAQQQIDLSGKWNDSDAQQVSATMVNTCLNDPWIGNFVAAAGRQPVIVVGTIYNKTDEHISSDVFIKDLERAFIQTNRARVVQGGAAVDELRAIRQDQQDFASAATRKRLREEVGADFVIQGTINKVLDADAKRYVYFYQIDLEMIDLESTEKIWLGQEKLKKYVEKNRYVF